VFIERDGVKAHTLAKKNEANIQAIVTEETWAIKDLVYDFWEIFLAGHRGSTVPSRQDILALFFPLG